MPTSCELFVLRDEKGPILYAPLARLYARVNESAIAAVARRLYGKPAQEGDAECLGLLEECGFFREYEQPHGEPRPPVQVTLFPTDGCNLRCRYCYAGAEKKRHVMPPEVGRAAIDLVAENAKKQDLKEFTVSFHGNGEPFFAFDRVREFCRYAREAADRVGLKVHLTMASNGVLNEKQLDWLLTWFESATISFDGTEELQNRQRPMADGGPSFPLVHRTLKRLNDAGKKFSIRSTLTASSADKLPEIAAFVLENYPNCNPLHVEPAWEAGRSLKTGEHTPEADLFIRKFLEADKILDGKMQLVYSPVRMDHVSLAFCGMCCNSFVVTSEGLVTSCYEVSEKSDSRSERYIYGAWNPEANGFTFDKAKQEELQGLTVDRMPYCADCFCKYHCSGDCAAKLLGLKPPSEHAGSVRCQITRALTLHQIQKKLNEEVNDHA